MVCVFLLVSIGGLTMMVFLFNIFLLVNMDCLVMMGFWVPQLANIDGPVMMEFCMVLVDIYGLVMTEPLRCGCSCKEGFMWLASLLLEECLMVCSFNNAVIL